MDPELKRLLEENLRVAEDTNALLHKMQTEARWGLVAKIILWALVIIVPLFFLQAYLEPYMELLQGSTGGEAGGGGIDFQKLLDEYQSLQQ
jgi:hypothetical protein